MVMQLSSTSRNWLPLKGLVLVLLFLTSLSVAVLCHRQAAIAQTPSQLPTVQQRPQATPKTSPATTVPKVKVIPAPPPVRRVFVSPHEIRGVWMTTNDADMLRDRTKLQATVTQLARMNFNTIYPVVWNSGYALYPSAVAQRTGIQPFVKRGLQGQDVLADLTNQAHRQGLMVLPWFEFGFMTPPTSELALAHPKWLTQQRDGTQTWVGAAGEVVWLNPFRPEVQQFITSLVLEVINQYNVDGIQFDDHTSLPNVFGYDPYTIALYRQETKKGTPSNPNDPGWTRWRANKITEFMMRLHKAIRDQKPNMVISVSPTSYDFAYRAQLQDWLTWVRKDIVDELVVQVYQPDLQSFVEKISRPEIQEAQRKIPTGAGVLTGLRTKPVPIQLIQAKVRSARERSLGVSFFYYESLWNRSAEPVAERQARFHALFPYAARRSVIQGMSNQPEKEPEL
jgi:uncharacterized lipoprotein YddW (UPF0748 family)